MLLENKIAISQKIERYIIKLYRVQINPVPDPIEANNRQNLYCPGIRNNFCMELKSVTHASAIKIQYKYGKLTPKLAE